MEITRYVNSQILKKFYSHEITIKELIDDSCDDSYIHSGWNIPIKIIMPVIEEFTQYGLKVDYEIINSK